jgi:ParB-like chromosome segregation protein Spo0J
MKVERLAEMGDRKLFHPLADVFPLLRGEAFQALVADIKAHGLLEPILVDAQDRILEGRNRYLACLEAGVEPRFVEWQGAGSPLAMVLSRNLHRRHLNESQRALVAARLARLLAAERGRCANLHTAEFPKSRDQAAAMTNVSPRLVASAIKVLRQGNEQLIAAVESGDLTVSAAAMPRQGGVRKNKPNPVPPCPGSFGLFRQPDNRPGPDLALLWVTVGALPVAMDALQSRGLQYQE